MIINLQEEWLTDNGKYKCPHCGKTYTKKGISTHIWRTHGDGKSHNPNQGYENGSRIIWNRGLTKETHSSLIKAGETYSTRIKNGEIQPGFLGKKHSDKSKMKMSLSASQNNRGGRCK